MPHGSWTQSNSEPSLRAPGLDGLEGPVAAVVSGPDTGGSEEWWEHRGLAPGAAQPCPSRPQPSCPPPSQLWPGSRPLSLGQLAGPQLPALPPTLAHMPGHMGSRSQACPSFPPQGCLWITDLHGNFPVFCLELLRATFNSHGVCLNGPQLPVLVHSRRLDRHQGEPRTSSPICTFSGKCVFLGRLT